MELLKVHQPPPSAYATAIGNNKYIMRYDKPSGEIMAQFPTLVPRSQSSSEAGA